MVIILWCVLLNIESELGNGGQGNTAPFGHFLGDACIIVAPDGYERSWNIYYEKSKADDVQFILDLIAKIAAEVPQADMNNVNIAGTSNGAALTYQLLINTGADRPFKRLDNCLCLPQAVSMFY